MVSPGRPTAAVESRTSGACVRALRCPLTGRPERADGQGRRRASPCDVHRLVLVLTPTDTVLSARTARPATAPRGPERRCLSICTACRVRVTAPTAAREYPRGYARVSSRISRLRTAISFSSRHALCQLQGRAGAITPPRPCRSIQTARTGASLRAPGRSYVWSLTWTCAPISRCG